MKKLILTFLFVFVNLLLVAQQSLVYTEVIKMDSVSKDELYYRAKTWFTKTYNNSQKVIQMDSKENGQIIGKAVIKYTPTVFSNYDKTQGYIDYTISVFIKDGKCKYEFTDFNHSPSMGSMGYGFGMITDEIEYKGKAGVFVTQSWRDKVWNDLKSCIKENIELISSNFKTSMLIQSETKNSDW